MSEDPINLHKHEFALPADENILMEAFETAAASFKVSCGLSKEYYYPHQPGEKEFKSSTDMQYTENYVLPPPQPDDKVQHEKNVKNKVQEKKDPLPVKNIKSTVPSSVLNNDEHPTYPPPLPLDSDPARNKMLHAWYWAGYYTGYADAQKQGK